MILQIRKRSHTQIDQETDQKISEEKPERDQQTKHISEPRKTNFSFDSCYLFTFKRDVFTIPFIDNFSKSYFLLKMLKVFQPVSAIEFGRYFLIIR